MHDIFSMSADEYVDNTDVRNPLSHYYKSVQSYLSVKYPNLTDQQRKLILDKIKSQETTPTVMVEFQPTEGNFEQKEVRLTEYIQSTEGTIFTPSGSQYFKPSQKESIIRRFSDYNTNMRKTYKSKMHRAKEDGDDVEANKYDNLQGSKKIFNNSGPGATGSMFNILCSLPNYNGTTSVGRYGVRTAYAHTEMFLRYNHFIQSYDDVAHMCILHQERGNKDIDNVLSTYSLYIPTADDVVAHLVKSLKYYAVCNDHLKNKIRSLVNNLSDSVRASLVYSNQLYGLIKHNQEFMRRFFARIITTQVEIVVTDPNDIYKLPETVREHVCGAYAYLYNKQKLDAAIIDQPEAICHVASIGKNIISVFEEMVDFFRAFFRTTIDVADIEHHPTMIRNAVIMSDTDSVMTTTEELVSWWADDPNPLVTEDNIKFHSAVIMMLQYTLAHRFKRMSAQFGMDKSDVEKRLSMKNEFFYPVFGNTAAGKHYWAERVIQEGIVLPEPKDETKGVVFRGSTIPKVSLEASSKFRRNIIRGLMTNPTISGQALIDEVFMYEQTIIKSLQSGEKLYIPVASIRQKEDYDNDPYITPYLYYELWQLAFAHEYGDIVLPDKCLKYPLRWTPALYTENSSFMVSLRQKYPVIHSGISKFRELFPSKKITSMIVPMTTTIPECMVPLINYRRIVRKNCDPFYLALQAMQLSTVSVKKETILTDYCVRDDIYRPEF